MENQETTGYDLPTEDVNLALDDEDNVKVITLTNMSQWINDMVNRMFSNAKVAEIDLNPTCEVAYLFPFSKEEAMYLGEEAAVEYIKNKTQLFKEYIFKQCDAVGIDDNVKTALGYQINEILCDMILSQE